MKNDAVRRGSNAEFTPGMRRLQSCSNRKMRFVTSATREASILPINFAIRAFQSRLRTWSARITPLIGDASGSGTSNGYPFTCDVIGQQSINPVRRLYSAGPPSGWDSHPGGMQAISRRSRPKADTAGMEVLRNRDPGRGRSRPAEHLRPRWGRSA